jgi:DNA-binding winged helix-turn-helix (wHTH) protein/TolB-like protein/Flp pilus assembly protein TadD
MNQQDRRIYLFGRFRLDVERRKLFKDDEAIALASKALEILVVLVENTGRVVEKDELMQMVWADSFVEEANLTVNMSALRKALGDSKNEPRYILTVSGRGYRFLMGVQKVEETDEHSTVDNQPPEQVLITAQVEQELDTNPTQTVEKNSALPVDKNSGVTGAEQNLSLVPIAELSQKKGNLTNLASSPRTRALLAIFTLALLFILYRLFFTSESSEPIKSIAILPFKPLSVDAGNEGLELGMAETLITKLSSIGRIIVRPTGTIRKYGNLEQDPLIAGRELGVDAVLDGHIQRAGDHLRITVHLRKVEDGISLWNQTYNQSFKDILEIQDTISEQVVKALTLTLTGAEQKQLIKHPTHNPDAYQAYLQGRYFWNKRTQESYKKATAYFDEALQIDPGFALAYSGLADCYLFRSEQLPARESMQKAKDAALKALKIDDTLAEAHTSLAKIKQFYDWDWAGAEESFQRAIALNPNYETAHHWYAQYLMDVGKQEEAFIKINRARELVPQSLIINTDVGSLFQDARQYDQAIGIYRRVIEMDANFARAHMELGRALEQKGLYDEALKEIGKAIELSQETPRMLASIGYIYAVSGNPAKAQQMIEKLTKQKQQVYVSPYHPAMIYAGLDKRQEALNLLEQAYQERFGLLVYLKIEPRFDNLRQEPQFKDLLRRIGLPQ